MKTLEETKKGLEICYNSVVCDECPYRYKPWTEGGRCVDGLQSDALAHIEQLEAQIPRWIPVEERLPEDRKIVLLGYDRSGITDCGYYDAEESEWCNYESIHVLTPTHWKPLPEPPKGGS